MGAENVRRNASEGFRSLSKREIDRRIEQVMASVMSCEDLDDAGNGEGHLRPRWISAAELVRRMRPFMIYN